MKIKGKDFTKSTYSGASTCVGVAMENNKVSVINTNERKTIVEFTNAEWVAFIKGVKNCEFDIQEN
jgi:hypothetical protein